jgi:hypothetical protein
MYVHVTHVCICVHYTVVQYIHIYGKEEEKAEAEVDALVVETAVKKLFLI